MLRALLRFSRRTRTRLQDICHRIANNGQAALPPPTLRNIGGGDFHLVGTINVRNLRQFVELDGKKILEVGCGCGRNALALATYDVDYHGFDIFKPYIEWSAAHIARNYPRFSFHHADVFNSVYNPRGTLRSEDFQFPFPDESFDLVLLTSVFTHMLERDVRRYIGEIARVLRAGGGVYSTFFLLDGEANRQLAKGRANPMLYPFDGERVKVASREHPEGAVGLDESMVAAMYVEHGLRILEIRHGGWCQRAAFFDFQDVIFATR